MANSDIAINALQIEKRPKSSASADRKVYQHVTGRDPICRACHQKPTTERHHIRGRKFTTAEDVCGLCDDCHDLLHVRVGGKKLKIYGDAEKRSYWGTPCGLTVERLVRGAWIKWCER